LTVARAKFLLSRFGPLRRSEKCVTGGQLALTSQLAENGTREGSQKSADKFKLEGGDCPWSARGAGRVRLRDERTGDQKFWGNGWITQNSTPRQGERAPRRAGWAVVESKTSAAVCRHDYWGAGGGRSGCLARPTCGGDWFRECKG